MHTQVFMPGELLEHCIGDSSNTKLQGCTIFYQRCAMLSYRLFDVCDMFSIIHFREFVCNFYHGMDIIDVQQSIPMRSRHAGIDLGNHIFCILDSRHSDID